MTVSSVALPCETCILCPTCNYKQKNKFKLISFVTVQKLPKRMTSISWNDYAVMYMGTKEFFMTWVLTFSGVRVEMTSWFKHIWYLYV